MQRVVVIGGGIIGLNTAYALQQRGVPKIIVIDEAPASHGASIVNAGWICPGPSHPLPSPGLVRKSLKGMLHEDSPLFIRPQFSDQDMARWLFQFWRSCGPTTYHH